MKTARKIGIVIAILGLGGLALFIALIYKHGAGEIAEAIASAGWGLLAVLGCHILTLSMDTLSWRALLPREVRPAYPRLFLYHWVGDSVSTLLPVAQVGGEVVRVRLLTSRAAAVPLPAATSSVLVGMTLSVATQIFFTLSGLALMVMLTGHGGLTRPIILASAIGALCVAGFYAVQRVGIFRMITRLIARLAKDEAWAGLVKRGEQLDADVRDCYARRRGIVESSFWLMCTWIGGVIEVRVALWALGIHSNFAQAYVLESMGQAIRSAMFLVPGTLGFQEGTYLLVGQLFGISAQASLALSLTRRVRELAFGIPGMVVWQWLEGRRFWMGSSAAPEPGKAQ